MPLNVGFSSLISSSIVDAVRTPSLSDIPMDSTPLGIWCRNRALCKETELRRRRGCLIIPESRARAQSRGLISGWPWLFLLFCLLCSSFKVWLKSPLSGKPVPIAPSLCRLQVQVLQPGYLRPLTWPSVLHCGLSFLYKSSLPTQIIRLLSCGRRGGEWATYPDCISAPITTLGKQQGLRHFLVIGNSVK